MLHHSINKGLAITCLLSIFSLTFISSTQRQDAQGAVAPASLAATHSISRKVLAAPRDACAEVTLDRYDNVYALLKRARIEADADVGTTLPGAPDALYNRNALDEALTQMQSTRTSWTSTYAPRGEVLNAAAAYQIFTTFEAVIKSVNNAQHWAITEASHSGRTPNHGHASFDLEVQALAAGSQMRVDAGHCYMAGYE